MKNNIKINISHIYILLTDENKRKILTYLEKISTKKITKKIECDSITI